MSPPAEEEREEEAAAQAEETDDEPPPLETDDEEDPANARSGRWVTLRGPLHNHMIIWPGLGRAVPRADPLDEMRVTDAWSVNGGPVSSTTSELITWAKRVGFAVLVGTSLQQIGHSCGIVAVCALASRRA